MNSPRFKLSSLTGMVLSIAELVSCAPVERPLGDATAGAAGQSGSAGSASGGSSSAQPCNPLDPVTSSVALNATEIVDAGRDAGGTVYVMTEEAGRLRLFVGNDQALVEQLSGLGSGEGTDDNAVQFWTVRYNDAQAMQVTVVVQKDATGLRMGVAKGPISVKVFDVGSMGVVLDPIAPTIAAAMPAQTTQAFHVDFAGVEVGSTTNLVVIEPVPLETDFNGFRLFIGPVGALAEQAGPIMVGRGSETGITFTSNGAPATLLYQGGQGTLTIGTNSVSVLGTDSPAVPPGAIFICQ